MSQGILIFFTHKRTHILLKDEHQHTNSTCISLIMILEDPRKHQSLPSDLNIQYKSIYTIMISPVTVLINARQFHTFT